MLSLLIDQCGADASDLPQLVRLNELIRAEEEGTGGGSSAAHSSLAMQAPPPPPLAAPVTAPVEVTRAPGQPARLGAESVPTRGEDHSMLSFLLNRCAGPGEQAQCAVLQQLREWLLEETHEGGANEAAEVNLAEHTATPHSRAPAHPAPSVVEEAIEPLPRRDDSVLSGVAATHENWADATTALPLTALPCSAPPPPLSVPVPILPDAGGWKGTTTFFHAETEVVSRRSAPPVTMRLASATAATGVSATVTDRNAMANGSDALRANAPPLLLRRTELPPKNNEEQSEGHRELANVLLSTPASLSKTLSASQASHKVPAGGEGRRAESEASTPLPLHYAPHLPSSAGRMPRPVNEVLATRNSATVRLLSGGGSTRPASATPPASRPMSGFAKRFVAELYERVSVTRAGALSSPIHPHQRRHPQHLPQALAAGSGVGAVRGHRAWSDRSPLRAHLAGAWHVRQGATAARVSLTQERVSQLAREGATRPPLSTPASLEYGHDGGAVGSGPLYPRGTYPHHPATVSPVVLPGARPLRPSSSLPRSGGGSGCASAVEPLADLMVVGTRIHLPSSHPMRRRYT